MTNNPPTVWTDGDPLMEAIAAAAWKLCRTEGTSLVVDDPRNIAAAVAGAARIVVLREAADECDEAGGAYTGRALNDHAGGAFALMETLLRKANEAEYVATPCSPGGCEDGGEPCTTHERLKAHAEGDHELCGDECRTPAPAPARR